MRFSCTSMWPAWHCIDFGLPATFQGYYSRMLPGAETAALQKTILLQVLTPLKNHVAAVAPAALIGVACGLLAIAFTIINLKVARARQALLQVLHSTQTGQNAIALFYIAHQLCSVTVALKRPCGTANVQIDVGGSLKKQSLP